jgi:ATP-dependent helicase HepA
MNGRPVKIGAFVWVSGTLSRLGVGKVAARAGGMTTVEFFHSIVRRQSEDVPDSQVNYVQRIASQTRCYVPDPAGPWRMGRIGRLFEGEYEVFFREGRACFLPEAAIYVRCLAPIDDPLETLIFKGHDTPFFHDRRFRFVRSLIRQRAACRGMTGLVSSKIDLFPHQVEVIRRVLEDPIQRYLLSDEVGLGKTIEAGVVVRQFLLDVPRGRVVIIVPPLLVDQWREELEAKFDLARFGTSRVVLLGSNAIGQATQSGPWGMVVLDEAHHQAGKAFAGPDEAQRFETIRRLCHEADRLLLLSATPVLNNERDFLAMLHLLDPQVYRLDDLEAFRERVRRRQEVGHFLLSLREGSPKFVLRSSLSRLRETFPQDGCLSQLANDLDCVLAAETVDPGLRDRTIRAIRVHISETYRLHRRMLRNRRGGVDLATLVGRSGAGEKGTPRILEYDIDERSGGIHDLLEEWRDAAGSASRAGGGLPVPEHDAPCHPLVRVFEVLLQCAGTWDGLLTQAVRCRLRGEHAQGLAGEFPAASLDLLRTVPLFSGERDILEALLSKMDSPSESGDRIDLLVGTLKNEVARGKRLGVKPKCVVFTGFSGVCREILRRLTRAFSAAEVSGYFSGLTADEVAQAVGRFRTHPACFVLVCDRAGEEGRNLQFADRVIHFDVPFSPNRMEQRIGRLDRIGRDRPVSSSIFVGPECPNSLFASWYRVLDEGFRVFDSCIASLQFFVDEQLGHLLQAAFQDGAQGLLARIPTTQEGIAREQERIAEQDALNAIDALGHNAVACFDAITRLDQTHPELEADTHGWVGEALLFVRDFDFYRQERVIHYQPDTDRRGELRTLVPTNCLQQQFAPHLNEPGTFDRAKALRTKGTKLFRIGEGFIDEMANYVRWDDRGQAFALWRHEPGWDPAEGAEWTGFRFNYVVSADLQFVRRVLKSFGLTKSALRSLSRRADELFPPLIEVVYLDTDLRPVADERLLAILGRPYLQRSKGGTDYNLANDRLDVLAEVVDPGRWQELCVKAREAAGTELLGRGTPPLAERCASLARAAERELEARFEQLRLRARAGGEEAATEDAPGSTLDLEKSLNHALVQGVRSPSLRLDSVGFLVIAGRAPPEGKEGFM